MKLTRIQVSNFLGARAVDLKLTKPAALIAGKNYAGKSSVQEAVRMALVGESVRVGLKKDYGALISEGQESGFAEVGTVDGAYSVVLPSGKGNHLAVAALPYVLDAQRFSRMADNDRRAFLFGLMGIKMDGATIKERLTVRGCDAKKVEQILPILRAGFDAAAKEAASKARDAKASWKTATGGETWGKEKAPKWQPAPLPEGAEHAAADLDKAAACLNDISGDLDAAQQALGAAKANQRQRQEALAKRSNLEAIAGNLGRYTTKLTLDQAELAAWESKVADCKARAGVVQPDPKSPGEFLLRGLAAVTQEFLDLSERYPDVEWDSGLLSRASKHLYDFIQLHGEPIGHDAPPDREAIAKLPEYEAALKLMRRSVENAKRDLEAATISAAQLKELDAMASMAADTGEADSRVADLAAKRAAAQQEVAKFRDIADKFARRQTLIEQVAKLHADVMDWTAIADALAPDGIQADLLSEALAPINRRLSMQANSAQWPTVNISEDISITYGMRDYAMLSESEKWRADAMIAEAVSHLSGIRLLVLDRLDVLDGQGREDALYWLDDLAEAKEIDTALLFCTLKALPAQLLPNIEGFWIENGIAGEIKEAA